MALFRDVGDSTGQVHFEFVKAFNLQERKSKTTKEHLLRPVSAYSLYKETNNTYQDQ